MAEATTTITVTPKQLGKHLRSIRRKKGLSLSEVARGAGLSRRELVAYERGKAPVPESDLWVLAGSCGVDVAELMPSASSLELTASANATSVGDTVSQLRRTQEDAGITPYLHTLQKLQALPAGKRIPVKERELNEIATALGSTPRSIEQKLQDVLHVSPSEAERLRAMILVPPNSKGKPRALAAAPSALAAAAAEAPPVAAVPTPPPFAEPVAPPVAPVAPPEPVQTFHAAPAAFLDQPLDAPVDAVGGHNVDVFEELARLPEPVPLGDPSAPLPDLLAPPTPFAEPLVGVPVLGPPEGAVELVDSAMPGAAAGAAAWSAADAPPIDVAMRQGSATWDLGQPPLEARSVPVDDPTTWETGGWQPPAPDGTNGTPAGFWEGTDDWTPTPAVSDVVETPIGEPMVIDEGTWAGSTWDTDTWSPPETGSGDPAADVNPWLTDEWPREPAERGAWDHEPDPAAVDSGFYVDWGTPETESAPTWDGLAESTESPAANIEDVLDPPFGDTWSQPDATFAPADPLDAPPVWDTWTPDTETVDPPLDAIDDGVDDAADAPPAWDTWTPAPDAVAVVVSEPFVVDAAGTVELTPISWRADAPDVADAVDTPDVAVAATEAVEIQEPIAPLAVDASAPERQEPSPAWTQPVAPAPVAPAPVAPVAEVARPVDDGARPAGDDFVVAGPDWQLGNALPLVEVRGQGGLVMRRADERWALADLTTTPDFVAEVEVDFRSGPGLGVLFRASVDDEGRMSGYSLDIDPIYDGGGFLVRQWHADRELWNPIARVSGDDPTSMYGTLLIRLEVIGEHLSAQVNGVEVLTVENLKQASTDRGRDAATGDRIGVQAWSSSDLVIDSVRVASR